MSENSKDIPSQKKALFRAVFALFFAQLRRETLLTSMLLLATLVGIVASVVIPLYYKDLFNHLAEGVPVPIPPLWEGPIMVTLFMILAISLVRWVSQSIKFFLMNRVDVRIMGRLQVSAFESILSRSHSFFTDNFTGSLLKKANRFVGSFEAILDGVLFNILPLLLYISGATYILFARHYLLGLIFGIWAVFFASVQVWLVRWKRPIVLQKSKKDSEVSGIFSDVIGNNLTVRLFARRAFEEGRFAKESESLQKQRLAVWDREEQISAIQIFLGVLIEFVVMVVAVSLWQKGVLTIGDFALIQAYILSSLNQLWQFANWFRRIDEAVGDAVEMMEIMLLKPEVEDRKDAVELVVKEGRVRFDGVTFGFKDENQVLTDFSLDIPAHEKVALVGTSGAGKSTVTKLITRLHDISGGTICIDDQNIATVTQESLRRTISFVPQEPVLFHRTLMDNIRYGRLDATDDEVYRAAQQAHCHDFIMKYKDGYETFVGERGVKLSGGERQRVAIARAILSRAPILILDEATSSLDSESEQLIQDALQKLMLGKTVIVIAHRLSTIMQMDRIVVVSDGGVVAMGTHSELLEENGLYAKLWSIQSQNFLAD